LYDFDAATSSAGGKRAMTALGNRILYVDHDPEDREVMLRLLRRQIFDVRAAGGRSAD
jgi:hypothetical protein